jgi:membrane protein DedA with SNARE-associated domain
MPEWLTEWFAADPSYSYVSVAVLFVLCGVGLPLPEEIILVSAGYLCYQGHADYWVMTLVCAGAILVGDVIPFLLGNLFGPRLLRLRWLRFVINRQRLATFDRWFRRRGDMVILIARFIPGLRVVAFFTGGTMRMKWRRFLLLDTCGIALTAPTFVFVGWHFGDKIHEAFRWVQQIEGALLYGALTAAGIVVLWYWLRQRARRKMTSGPRETIVKPSRTATTEPAETTETDRPPDLVVETEESPATGADSSQGEASEKTPGKTNQEPEPGIDIPQPERHPDDPRKARKYLEPPRETDDAGPDATKGGADAGDHE